MKDRIYIATYSENAVEVIRRFGLNIELNDLCISEMLDADKVDKTVSAMEEEIRNSHAEKIIVHGPFTEIIPASIDHRAVSLGLTRLEEAYEVCRRIGADKMVVHTGFLPLIYFKEWNHEKSVCFWKNFMENKPKDFNIYIENVFEDEPMMMKALIEEIADSRVRICLDVGHANAATLAQYQVTDWIKQLGPYIGHIHLHNNDGTKDRHNPVFSGSMDMEEILAAAADFCPKDVTMTIESRRCEESAAWLLEYAKRSGAQKF